MSSKSSVRKTQANNLAPFSESNRYIKYAYKNGSDLMKKVKTHLEKCGHPQPDQDIIINNIHAGVLLFYGDHVLLVHQAKTAGGETTKWGPPKGTADTSRDMSALDTAIRELAEEAGISANDIKLLDHVIVTPAYGFVCTMIYFIAFADTLVCPKAGDREISEVAWIPIEKVFSMDITSTTRLVLNYVFVNCLHTSSEYATAIC